jgi:uncharacterized protein with NAD-binding domain and iron-sulfur cluster
MAIPRRKTKVAILGGGVGAMTAAFCLTEGPNAGRYDITVYQMGWRLGGKGASGRNPALHDRIEEHGLHIWFGFYYNALPLMRRCYEALGDPHDTFENAFTPHDYVVLEEHVDGQWAHFPLDFPRAAGGGIPMPLDYVRKILKWLREHISRTPLFSRNRAEHGEAERPRTREALASLGRPDDHDPDPAHLIDHALELLNGLEPDADDAQAILSRTLALLNEAKRWVRARIRAAIDVDEATRRAWMIIDLGAAVVRGMITDDVIFRGFQAIDDHDVWEWLERHGADPEHRDSVAVRTLYSQAFAFPEGDIDGRAIGAGTALRTTLRMLFAYQGAFMWKMNAGMGDIVFTPFYRVLKRRGVRFEFFSRVRGLHLSTDKRRVERITIGRQLRVKDEPYHPLVRVPDPRVGERLCWPNGPDLRQIDDRQARRIRALQADPDAYVNLESHWSSWRPADEDVRTLECGTGKDFDAVVLGISLGALPELCRELIAVSPPWRRMVEKVKTVRTQAFQLWLTRDLGRLGWRLKSPVSTAYVEPLDTWADMNQTRPAEPWPRGAEPAQIAYFCGVLPDSPEPRWFQDPTFPKREARATYDNMVDFLKRDLAYLWPAGTTGGTPDRLAWDILFDPTGAVGQDRLASQYWVANIDPNERYVLSVPGSLQHRLWSDQSGFDNLFLAGDWTRNAISAGCVEAAVTSGMRASRGLSGHPASILGESDP